MNTLPMKEILSGLSKMIEAKIENEDLEPDAITALKFAKNELDKLSNEPLTMEDMNKVQDRLIELNDKLKTIGEK